MRLKLTPEEYAEYCAEYNAWLDDQEHSEQILNLQAVIDAQPERTDDESFQFHQVDIRISSAE